MATGHLNTSKLANTGDADKIVWVAIENEYMQQM